MRTAGPWWRGSSHSATAVRRTDPRPDQTAWALAFRGTFEHTLDAKNRLTVPSKFRTALAGGVVLVKSVDRCISVYPEDVYSAQTQAALSGLNPLSPEARDMKRVLFTNATDVELDGAGRIMVPAGFLEYAGIEKRDVVVAGAGDCLELWDRAGWQAYHADLTRRAPDLTASLGHPA
jgi:MraZ protein